MRVKGRKPAAMTQQVWQKHLHRFLEGVSTGLWQFRQLITYSIKSQLCHWKTQIGRYKTRHCRGSVGLGGPCERSGKKLPQFLGDKFQSSTMAEGQQVYLIWSLPEEKEAVGAPGMETGSAAQGDLRCCTCQSEPLHRQSRPPQTAGSHILCADRPGAFFAPLSA